MEKISDRVDGYVEKKRKDWGGALGNFVAGIFEGIGNRYVDRHEGDIMDTLHDTIAQISDGLPEDAPVKKIADRLNGKRSGWMLIAGLILLPFIIIPMITSVLQPTGRLLTYWQDNIQRTYRDMPDNIIKLWHIDPTKYEYLFDDLRDQGWGEDKIEYLKELAKVRLSPEIISRIWLRNKEGYEPLWKDLRDQGWSEERIGVVKELAYVIPPLADMVRFADFSAFDESVIERWREQYDAPAWIKEPFELIGIKGDWANKYWFSHWKQPGRFELAEMYRRGLIDEEIVDLAYLTQGFSSFWRPHLAELLKEVPTRVDIRRWWDMRTIDETRLRELYKARGYFGKDLEDYILWTKVYVAFPDLIARWKNGWISLEDVRRELTALGMPAERVEEMIQSKITPLEAERVSKERDLTKTDIIKGVKKEVITWSQGVELLMDLGYSEDEADYILAINIAAEAGSPETFEDFKDLTQKWRLAAGKEAKPVPEELKKAADEVVSLTKDIEALEAAIKEEKDKLIPEEELPEAATEKLTELQVKLHRAESELARVKSEYDRLVAEWKQAT